MTQRAPVYGLLGALSAFPRRLAARAAERRGARLRRGVDRATTHVVLGRSLLARADAETAARVVAERAAGRVLLGEAGFAASLAAAPGPVPDGVAGLTDAEVRARSGLGEHVFELLRLFDAFETPAAPFQLRDLILARKYAGLLAEGAGWGDIARSVGRACRVSLTAKALERGPGAIYARDAGALAELDGQLLLGLDGPGATPDDLFSEAEEAEAEGRLADAAVAYARCLALDPGDATAAFNRANCLRGLGREDEAERDYARALNRAPDFVEAWFNLAGLSRARGRVATARSQLARAIAADPAYADAVYNLATLEFEAGDLAAAERWWRRYLELDDASEWARLAARGLRFVALARGR